MKRDGNDPANWPGMEVAIEGAGLRPADVPARHLAALLEAAAGLFDAVAAERGTKVEPPRLVEVRIGSAAYQLRSPDTEAAAVAEELEEHVRTRGQGASATVRHALDRLHKANKGLGSIRIARFDAHGRMVKKPVHLAPPLSVEAFAFEEAREISGVVIAVDAGLRKGAGVKLRLDDGGVQLFDADIGLAMRAARLFTKRVRAMVSFTITGDREADGAIEEIEEASDEEGADSEPLIAFDAIAGKLSSHGVSASAWLDDLLADDEE